MKVIETFTLLLATYYYSAVCATSFNSASVSTFSLVDTNGLAAADTGAPTTPLLSYPSSLVYAYDGKSIYLTDTLSSTIKKVTPFSSSSSFSQYSGSLRVETIAGVSGETGDSDGLGQNALFQYPCVVEGDIYVADTNSFLIKKVTVDGNVSNLAGTGEKGLSVITTPTAFTNASFQPTSLAASPDANLIFAIDSTKGALYSLNLTSQIITPLLYGSTALRLPFGITVSLDFTVYISQISSSQISAYSYTLKSLTLVAGGNGKGLTDGNSTVSQFKFPNGLALDTYTNQLFVSDVGNDALRSITGIIGKNGPPFIGRGVSKEIIGQSSFSTTDTSGLGGGGSSTSLTTAASTSTVPSTTIASPTLTASLPTPSSTAWRNR